MDADRMAACFNEWMRRYIEAPDQFSRELQEVAQFQEDGEPSYGRRCVALLLKIDAELAASTTGQR